MKKLGIEIQTPFNPTKKGSKSPSSKKAKSPTNSGGMNAA